MFLLHMTNPHLYIPSATAALASALHTPAKHHLNQRIKRINSRHYFIHTDDLVICQIKKTNGNKDVQNYECESTPHKSNNYHARPVTTSLHSEKYIFNVNVDQLLYNACSKFSREPKENQFSRMI